VEISIVADLDRFFAQRDHAEQGVEPDWSEHLAGDGAVTTRAVGCHMSRAV
jgi:hypothetical protein